MKKIAILSVGASLYPALCWAQGFNNQSVISLHQAGLGDPAIVAKVNSSPCGYDVSTDGLIALKKAGISDGVIATMVERCNGASVAQGANNSSADPLVKHSPGIYLMEDWNGPAKLELICPTTGGAARTTGNSSLLFPLKSILVIPGSDSQTRSFTTKPTFYFYFDTADRKVSDFGVEKSLAAQSPNEFSLVKFRQKGNSREIENGRASAYFSINIHKGVNAKDTSAFSAEEIGDGIFRVKTASDLVPGEYAFIFSGESGRSRLYDFSIVATQGGTPAATSK